MLGRRGLGLVYFLTGSVQKDKSDTVNSESRTDCQVKGRTDVVGGLFGKIGLTLLVVCLERQD